MPQLLLNLWLDFRSLSASLQLAASLMSWMYSALDSTNMLSWVIDSDRKRCVTVGMDGFIAKPIVLSELKKAISLAIAKSS